MITESENKLGQQGRRTEQLDFSGVFRDDRGQIRWNLPGNTPEENEQLGIRNIQALFLERFLEFDQLFPRTEGVEIIEDKRIEAEEFILERVGTSEKFNRIFGQSPRDKRKVAYFGGSHLTILKKSFTPWGIEFARFNLPQVDRQTGIWIDEEGQSWVNAGYFTNKFGVDIEGFRRFLEDARSMTGLAKNNQATLLYNEADVEEKFTNFRSIPQIDTTNDVYVDENGRKWVGVRYLCNKYGVSGTLIKRLVRNADSGQVRNPANHLTTLYAEEQVAGLLRDITSLPTVDRSSGKYTDENGQVWIPLTQIAQDIGVTTATIKKRLVDIQGIRGRDKSGKEVVLYNESEVSLRLKQFVQLPRVDIQTERYIDETNFSWVTAQTLAREIGVPVTRVQLLLKDMPYITGRNSVGREAILYPEDQSREIIKRFLTVPQLDKKTEVYIDANEETWSTAFYFRRRFGKVAGSLLDYTTPIAGIASNGVEVKLYPQSVVREKVDEYLRLPQVDQKTGKFVDDSGEIWASVSFFHRRFKISDTFARNLLENSSFMIVRDKGGRRITLYPETATVALFNERLSQRLGSVSFQSGRYIDPDGEGWVTLLYLQKEYGLDYSALKRRVGGIETKPGINRSGVQVVLFKESKVRDRLKDFVSLPSVDKETGRLIDEDGNSWVTLAYIDSLFRKSTSLSRRLLKDVSTLNARNRTGRQTKLFPEAEAIRRLQAFYDLPAVDKNTGRYIDEEGKTWVSTEQLAVELGINGVTCKKLGKDLPTIEGRDRMGKEVDLINEIAAREIFGFLADLPIVDSTGRFIDTDGNKWVVESLIFKELGISTSDKRRQALNLESIEGRGRNGHKVILYKEQDVRDKLDLFLALPQVDKETGRYVDEEGVSWVPFQYFREQFGITKDQILRENKDLPVIKGRDRRGQEAELFDEQAMVKLIEERMALPKVDETTGIFTNQEGVTWTTVNVLSHSCNLHPGVILRQLESSEVPFILGKGLNNVISRLFNEVEAKKAIDAFIANRDRNLSISPEEANEQLARLVESS